MNGTGDLIGEWKEQTHDRKEDEAKGEGTTIAQAFGNPGVDKQLKIKSNKIDLSSVYMYVLIQ